MIDALLAAMLLMAPPSFDIDRLMADLASVTQRDDRFTESRTDPLLGSPQVSSGRLLWQAPDRVEKITEQPAPERFILEGTTVTLTRPGQPTRSLSVNADPRLTPLVESLRGVLAGDRKGLERHFTLTLTGDRDDWTLTLAPRSTSVKETVASVVYTGHDHLLLRVVTTDAGGGVSTMTVTSP